MPYLTLKGSSCDIIVLNEHAPTENKDDIIKEQEHIFNQFPRYHMNMLLGDINELRKI
jgi:hypothetical protein